MSADKQLIPTSGGSVRQEFAATELTSQRETSAAAVAARERAIVEAEYIMAERHPRNWMDVRAAMLDHCSRPRFSEFTRYARKVGSKLVNGEWVDEIARGFTIRFAQTLAQEMRNVKPFVLVTYEDDMLRIVRFGVVDLERNLPRSREVAIAKVAERRGKKRKGSDEWEAPEGRETVSVRLNSEGIPTYTVKATPEELRAKINAEESRTIRDFILRLCPPDILEDCEDKVYITLGAEDKRDPKAAVKRLCDRFQEFGIRPSDLETYMGRPVKDWTLVDIKELRELGASIRDNMTTFEAALKAKYAKPDVAEETPEEHDARLRVQMAAQGPTSEEVAERKITEMKAEPLDMPDYPDVMSLPKGAQIRIKGIIYMANDAMTGWVPVQADGMVPPESATEAPSMQSPAPESAEKKPAQLKLGKR